MNIALIHPSRGRAQRAYEAAEKWAYAKSDIHNVFHVICIDNDDPDKEKYDHNFSDQLIERETLKYSRKLIIYDKPDGDCVKATNFAAAYACESFNPDILIFLADDFDMPPANWDTTIASKNAEAFDKRWILKVADGVQDPNNTIITQPIMSRAMYDHLGYMWNPEYKSMWVDVDLFFTCKPWILFDPTILIQHNHPTWVGSSGKMDDTYNRSAANWNQGATVFNRRLEENNWKLQGAEPARLV